MRDGLSALPLLACYIPQHTRNDTHIKLQWKCLYDVIITASNGDLTIKADWPPWLLHVCWRNNETRELHAHACHRTCHIMHQIMMTCTDIADASSIYVDAMPVGIQDINIAQCSRPVVFIGGWCETHRPPQTQCQPPIIPMTLKSLDALTQPPLVSELPRIYKSWISTTIINSFNYLTL